MSWAILNLIRFYWLIFPETKRRQCLFRETCSNHVYRLIKEKGFIKGFLGFISRIKKCRSGYTIYVGNKGFEVKLADGTTINQDEISPQLLEGIPSLISDLVTSSVK
ncbi:MAG: membrane protein insertion efficiency factor YidD [Saprospiraceae bacterium]|nr:membrane protein insertion efficiency factor YidD [Saprospiraceae bacterium]